MMDNKYLYIIIIVIVVASVLVAVFKTSGSNSAPSALIGAKVNQSEIAQLYEIAMNSTLANQIGSGTAAGLPTPESGAPIIEKAQPTVVYVGAEDCPYCAATRWGLIIALMRFGNFTGLSYMQSSSTDVYPNTPTFTFYGSSYSSSAVNFMPVETLTRNYSLLEVPNNIQNETYAKYDKGVGVPFIDFNNQSIQLGSEIDPQILDGHSWGYITQELKDPSSTFSQAIIGNANVFTAQICRITNNTPKSVCSQPYVSRILTFQ
jgi:thiol-disulfide isomerase/thioredoxin